MTLRLIVSGVYDAERIVAHDGVDEVLAVMPRSECSAGWLRWPALAVPRTVVEVSDIGYGGLVGPAEMDAICTEHPDIIAPRAAHAEAIIAAGRRALRRGQTRQWTLLCHCQSGISRSVAAALLILALQDGPGQERQSWNRLQNLAGPEPLPNANLVHLGDAALSRHGRLYAAMSV